MFHACMLLPFRGEDGGGAPLDDVGNAVELGRLPPKPEFVEGRPIEAKLLRHDGIAAAGAGKAGGLREGAEFDGAALGPLNLVNAPGKGGIVDEALVSGVEKQHRPAVQSVIHPRLQLLPVIDRAGGIIGGAEVDDVRLHRRVRQGEKAVFSVGIHVKDLPPRHDVGVHIYRIDRIRNQHGVVGGKEIEDVAEVAFCAVADENFAGAYLSASTGIIFLHGVPEEIIALLRAVAPEGGGFAHFGNGGVHGFDHRRAKR